MIVFLLEMIKKLCEWIFHFLLSILAPFEETQPRCTIKNSNCTSGIIQKPVSMIKNSIPTRLYFSRLKNAFMSIGFTVADVESVLRYDPSLKKDLIGKFELLFSTGIWAIFFYRLSHFLYVAKIPIVPKIISWIVSLITGIEIHPAALIGKGFIIDHGNGVVIGETTEIGDNVLIFHQVTLGAARLQPGKRHPTLRNNVMIGAGAKIIGAVEIGDNTQIGAGSVVVKSIPRNSVVVGNPARVIKQNGKSIIYTDSLSDTESIANTGSSSLCTSNSSPQLCCLEANGDVH